jgi:hypothetical protein
VHITNCPSKGRAEWFFGATRQYCEVDFKILCLWCIPTKISHTVSSLVTEVAIQHDDLTQWCGYFQTQHSADLSLW